MVLQHESCKWIHLRAYRHSRTGSADQHLHVLKKCESDQTYADTPCRTSDSPRYHLGSLGSRVCRKQGRKNYEKNADSECPEFFIHRLAVFSHLIPVARCLTETCYAVITGNYLRGCTLGESSWLLTVDTNCACLMLRKEVQLSPTLLLHSPGRCRTMMPASERNIE